MKKTLALLLWGMLVSPTSAEEISAWEPVQDGNMIVTIRAIDKDGIHEVRYKYHLKGLPIRLNSCDEIQRIPKMDEIWLITQEARPYMSSGVRWYDTISRLSMVGSALYSCLPVK